jgi:mono/diheme cytochrome c family protein
MKKFLAIVFVAALSVSAFAADGAAVYKSKCAGCHGPAGSPPAALVSALGVKAVNTPAVKKMGVAGVSNIVAKGQGKMPAFGGKMSAADIKAVASYVLTLKK